jgi:hypothetical protein
MEGMTLCVNDLLLLKSIVEHYAPVIRYGVVFLIVSKHQGFI